MQHEVQRGLFREFPFSFESVIPFQESAGLSVYYVTSEPGLYILDAPEGRKLACDPSIVGEEFDSLNRALANKVWAFLSKLEILKRPIIFEHVLRAAPGYRLREAVVNLEVIDFYLRPRYVEASYRHHTQNEVEVVFASDLNIKPNQVYTLVKPDTEATGRSSVESIKTVVSSCHALGSRVGAVLLYGFISLQSYKVLSELARRDGFKLFALAIEDVTALASNGYDMPIYGLDEEVKRLEGKSIRLASLIPEKVLKEVLREYFPGMDQPGDWSERQTILYNGTSFEEGQVSKHLSKSLAQLESLRQLSKGEPWYSKIHEDIYESLRDKLQVKLGKVDIQSDDP